MNVAVYRSPASKGAAAVGKLHDLLVRTLRSPGLMPAQN